MKTKPYLFRTSIILILFFVGQFVIAQNLKHISSQDTLYYYFKSKKDEKKSGLRLFTPPNWKSMKYYVNLSWLNEEFYFTYNTHKKKEGKFIGIPVLTKDRKFLKLNKDNILTLCELKKINTKTLEDFYWKNKNKVIYLIDKKENKKGKIFLRRVNWGSSYLIQQ